MKKITILLFVLILITGCGVPKKEHEELNSKLQKSIKTINKQKIEIFSLKKQIEDLKFGPDKLLKASKNLFEEKKYKEASSQLALLNKKHPHSQENKDGKVLKVKIDNLIKKIKKEEELKKKKMFAKAVKGLFKKYDKIEKITWYHDRYENQTYKCRVYLYFGRLDSGTLTYLRFCLRFHSEDSWLFVKNYTIQVNDKNFDYTPTKKLNRYNSSGSVWESLDIVINKRLLEIVQKIAVSKSTIIRFHGSEGIKDHYVSRNEKRGIKQILTAYKAMGGTL